jgi:hypothetical protein
MSFWGENPNILIQSYDFFPVETMSFDEKLNAITRAVIVVGIILFVVTQNPRIVFVSALTLGAIFMIHLYQVREDEKKKAIIEEKFSNPADDVLKKAGIARDAALFDEPDSSNPFGNPLATDYADNPQKKPAPPAFTEDIGAKITQQAKKMVQELNPGQPDIADKLFRDLGEQFVFEQSLRQFSSNPSTTTVNDQTGFADFCYGSMTSCKEGNLFACARQTARN